MIVVQYHVTRIRKMVPPSIGCPMPLAYGLGLCGCDAGALLLSTCMSPRAAPHFLASRLTAKQLPLVLTERQLDATASLSERIRTDAAASLQRWEPRFDSVLGSAGRCQRCPGPSQVFPIQHPIIGGTGSKFLYNFSVSRGR